jgi:hypothetical protein
MITIFENRRYGVAERQGCELYGAANKNVIGTNNEAASA